MIQGKNIEVLSPEMPYLSAIKALMYLATHTIYNICLTGTYCPVLVLDRPKGALGRDMTCPKIFKEQKGYGIILY